MTGTWHFYANDDERKKDRLARFIAERDERLAKMVGAVRSGLAVRSEAQEKVKRILIELEAGANSEQGKIDSQNFAKKRRIEVRF